VLREELTQSWGAGLLPTLEEELEVRGGCTPLFAQRVERSDDRDDRCLVVARRAGVETPLAGDRARVGDRHLAAARLERRVAERRSPRGRGPLGSVDRLPVVVRAEHDRARGGSDTKLAEDGGGLPGASSSRADTPRRASIATRRSALRWILAEWVAMLGRRNRSISSRVMSRS
jgi:hypothetical protein